MTLKALSYRPYNVTVIFWAYKVDSDDVKLLRRWDAPHGGDDVINIFYDIAYQSPRYFPMDVDLLLEDAVIYSHRGEYVLHWGKYQHIVGSRDGRKRFELVKEGTNVMLYDDDGNQYSGGQVVSIIDGETVGERMYQLRLPGDSQDRLVSINEPMALGDCDGHECGATFGMPIGGKTDLLRPSYF